MSLGIYEFKINDKQVSFDVNKNIEEQLEYLDEKDRYELIFYLCLVIKNEIKN